MCIYIINMSIEIFEISPKYSQLNHPSPDSPAASLSLGSTGVPALDVRRLVPMWRADCTFRGLVMGNRQREKMII